MAESQQVWVTWRGSKLLHKSCLRVDLPGGVLSQKQEESQDGSPGNLSAHLPWGWSCGTALAAPAGPSSPSQAGTSLLLSC